MKVRETKLPSQAAGGSTGSLPPVVKPSSQQPSVSGVITAQAVTATDTARGDDLHRDDARTLIDAGAPTVAPHAMRGPSSWVAARLTPEETRRRTLRSLTKLLDSAPLDLTKLGALGRTAVDGGFGATFAQALAPRAAAVLAAALDGSSALPDLLGALELLRELLPAQAFVSVAAQATPALRVELAALAVLSEEIMKLPRGVDGRATQRAVDRVEQELVPRVRLVRALAGVAALDVHALLAVGAREDAARPSPGAMKAISQIATQRKGEAREISVHVQTRADAEGILSSWLAAEPLVDTSAMSPTLVKHLLGRARTFHWDDTYGKDGVITGHYPGSDHGLLPHLQIHTADGQEVRVFFPKQFAHTEEGA